MTKVRNLFRKSAIVVPLLAMTSALLVAPPASAGSKPPTNTPKQYVASISMTPAGSDVTLTVTLLNMPGSATLGSARITVPTAFTNLGTPTISAISANKLWRLSKSANVINLTARSDSQKLQPSQFISVSFTATPPTAPGTYTFLTAAKASTGFTGTSNFTRLGTDPAIVICGTGSCSASFGDVNNPQPDIQAGEASLDDPCEGCTLTINGTPGDFCATPPNPPSSPCHTHIGPDFVVGGGYNGNVTFVVSCNVVDCPIISGGPSTAGVDFYPVFFDPNDGPTTSSDNVQMITDSCPTEGSIIDPCLVDSGRFSSEGGGTDYYQSTLEVPFFTDPKIMH